MCCLGSTMGGGGHREPPWALKATAESGLVSPRSMCHFGERLGWRQSPRGPRVGTVTVADPQGTPRQHYGCLDRNPYKALKLPAEIPRPWGNLPIFAACCLLSETSLVKPVGG